MQPGYKEEVKCLNRTQQQLEVMLIFAFFFLLFFIFKYTNNWGNTRSNLFDDFLNYICLKVNIPLAVMFPSLAVNVLVNSFLLNQTWERHVVLNN